MVLTGTMIAAATGYIVNEIKQSKGAKEAADELSTGIWNWIKPIFLEENKKLVEKIEENPEKYESALELAIEEKAEKDADFDKELATRIKETAAKVTKSNTTSVVGDDNEVIQDVTNSNINITKTNRQINQGDNSTYNEHK